MNPGAVLATVLGPAAVLLALAGTAASDVTLAAGTGVRFQGLAPCADGRLLVFRAVGPRDVRPDTLCLNPETADLYWGGGAIRGLAAGHADTVIAATRVERLTFVGGSLTDRRPWRTPVPDAIPADVASWPAVRNPVGLAVARPAGHPGPVEPFPERYLRLRDGTVIFLIDAEHPPHFKERFHDLHARLRGETEWTVSRNLAVRGWVVSPDSTSWALAARGHVPDYGGGMRDVVIAGRGESIHTFPLPVPEALLWDGAGWLWVLDGAGRLLRIRPTPGAWETREIDAADDRCGCAPDGVDSVWTWTVAAAGSNRAEILAGALDLESSHPEPTPSPWVSWDENGRPLLCFGGYPSREALLAADGRAPVTGAEIRRAPLVDENFVGTAERLPLRTAGGTATLRHVHQDGRAASEIWWRFTTRERAVRMAGPWGL